MSNSHIRNEQLIETLGFYRGLLLDAVEAEMSESKAWPVMRSRILRLLGDKGLEGKVRDILQLEPSYNPRFDK